MKSVRRVAFAKIAIAFLVYVCIVLLVRSVLGSGGSPGKLGALAVIPVAVAWAGLIELITGIRFRELSPHWNVLPWWKQWPYAFLLFVAFFMLWVLFAGLAAIE